MKILVTGVAGFIGSHVTKALCEEGHQVVGLDSLNDYYSPKLKQDRLNELDVWDGFRFVQMDLVEQERLFSLFTQEQFDQVIHLAAQAGVRHSISHPMDYVQSNLLGFMHILEACRHHSIGHLVYASSSSVYGDQEQMPFHEAMNTDHPFSLYAATKKSNEVLAHSYSHLFGMAMTGLRFFTVYGPWGRPDMAPWKFTEAILTGRPIQVYNQGQMLRDFTYIDDIVRGIVEVAKRPPRANPTPYTLYNIGNNRPVPLMDFIRCIEKAAGKNAQIEWLAMQPGDVLATYADIDALEKATGVKPRVQIEEGIGHFVDWFVQYHQLHRDKRRAAAPAEASRA
ncbi:NAD-dependent epimerase/dehydratase family protein [Aliiglaciecola sp. CAU 1673]|uniref:NAD-dependent epimerase/dehydratase family protein n=1 Tax=Aliiglaciecola sp. CAU 1673 TaxID=3032595 RepID=UPI0023DCD2D9|nr:NAD-dependent epimerase/dehydratase family protein [Aliiglaciecola sp. CAU 1673]MDF2177280.1 NAD-dependent epimerase/dehydratase family protein [Aliiglaciecola sp. CAU 1673]